MLRPAVVPKSILPFTASGHADHPPAELGAPHAEFRRALSIQQDSHARKTSPSTKSSD
jgi:hypothetical protein